MVDDRRVFIGSSVKAIHVANDLQQMLEYDAKCSVWNQGFFGLNLSTLEGLLESINRFDFGIFVFYPDDDIIISGETEKITRDNVLFEFGLFMGKLGRSRSFIVRSKDDIRMLSDLSGVTVASFAPYNNSSEAGAALGPACNQIRGAMHAADEKWSKDMIQMLSPNFIYVLRHVIEINQTRPALFFRPVLHHFQRRMGEKCANIDLSETDGWDKTADYAFRYLELLGLISRVGAGNEYRITRSGEKVLVDPHIQRQYGRAFDEDLLSLPQ